MSLFTSRSSETAGVTSQSLAKVVCAMSRINIARSFRSDGAESWFGLVCSSEPRSGTAGATSKILPKSVRALLMINIALSFWSDGAERWFGLLCSSKPEARSGSSGWDAELVTKSEEGGEEGGRW
jgi:hypothetical protein